MNFSVIIPTHNRKELLLEALNSLARQAHSKFDVIVVNDGGTAVRGLIEAFSRFFPIQLIELKESRGVSNARNRGIEAASGDYLAFLDDDDIFLPQHLMRAKAVIESYGCEAAYFGALVSDKRIDSMPEDISGLPTKAYTFDGRFLLVSNYIHTGSLVVRNLRDVPARFDLSLDICEDWDFWITLHHGLGYRIVSSSEVTTIYHQVPGSHGMCVAAEKVHPTPFATARRQIYAKWPTRDPLVIQYRQWMTDFEVARNDCIMRKDAIPMHVFDRVTSYLHQTFVLNVAPDSRKIHEFLSPPKQTRLRKPTARG